MLVGISSRTFAEVRGIMSRPERKFSIPPSEGSPFRMNRSMSIAVMGVAAVGKNTLVSGFLRYWSDVDRVVELAGDKRMERKELDVEIVDILSEQFLLEKNIPTADVYVLVYSVVCEESLTSVMSLRDDIVNQFGKDVPMVIVANKTDLTGNCKQAKQAAMTSLKSTKDHVMVSAELAEGIDTVLHRVIKKFLKQMDTEKRPKRVKCFKRLRKLFSRSARVTNQGQS